MYDKKTFEVHGCFYPRRVFSIKFYFKTHLRLIAQTNKALDFQIKSIELQHFDNDATHMGVQDYLEMKERQKKLKLKTVKILEN